MLFEAEVVFLEKKPFVFVNKDDVHTIEKNHTYDFLVSTTEEKLTLHRNSHYTLCSIGTDSYQFRQLDDRTFLCYRPKQKRKEDSKDIDVLRITTDSKKLLSYFAEMTSRKVRTVYHGLGYTPSKKPNTSLLSTESHQQRFRGFLNLGVIIIVLLNIRNIITNFFKYGNQLAAGEITMLNGNGIPALLMMGVYILLQYQIEMLLFSGRASHYTCRLLTIVNVLSALVFNGVLCQRLNILPMPALLITGFLVALVLKLISYYQINSEVYQIAQKIKKTPTNDNYRDLFAPYEVDSNNLELIAQHKDNLLKLLSFRHYMYFMAAPTLCYQLEYPKNPSIRWIWLAKRCVEFAVIGALQLILLVQYYLPTLDKLVRMVQTGTYTYLSAIEGLLQLSIPNILFWISGFYMFFQVWLNILGELLRFADRRFYDVIHYTIQDWWNCKNLAEYWQQWNLPVHYWFVRHLYNPMLKKGLKRSMANLVVFLISAVAHEYLVSVPLGLLSYYAFLAMLLQSPMIFFELKFNKALKLDTSQLGNVSFWISYCVLGQPICVGIYYYLYVTK